jgi:Tfp pilus assembly protein PilF
MLFKDTNVKNGVILFYEGQYVESKDKLENALNADNYNVVAAFYLARIFEEANKMLQARFFHEQVLRIMEAQPTFKTKHFLNLFYLKSR